MRKSISSTEMGRLQLSILETAGYCKSFTPFSIDKAQFDHVRERERERGEKESF